MAGLFGAVDLSNFCSNAKDVIQILGWVLTIFKIAIPLIVVFYGAFDLGKAVIASKDDEIKKAQGMLIKRIIYAVAVFLVVTLVTFVMGLVGSTEWRDCWNNVGGATNNSTEES